MERPCLRRNAAEGLRLNAQTRRHGRSGRSVQRVLVLGPDHRQGTDPSDGVRLRSAARLLALTIDDPGYPAAASVRLIAKLMALAEAVSELRKAQQHAAQTAAARRAAEQLHADLARARHRTAYAAHLDRPARTRPVDAEDVISRDFPLRLRPGVQLTADPDSSPAVSRPSYERQSPKRAGPRP